MSKRRSNEDKQRNGVKKRKTVDDNHDFEQSQNQSQNPDFDPVEKEAEVGIVESIHLKNFMCHSVLEFSFNPNVSFVVGRNGSGKSAVLTGLVIGLGGTIRGTKRGTALRDIVKVGKSSAEILIKLRNRGQDAFKPEKYGKSILVQRRIKADGGSSYSIKSWNAHVVSTKKEELENILDHFNIQVENPISILNQETSRSFLQTTKEEDLYKFFLAGTQLQDMKAGYMQAQSDERKAKEFIDAKEASLPALEKKVREYERKFKALDVIKNAKQKVERLKGEMAWSWVSEAEQAKNEAEKALSGLEKKSAKLTEKLDQVKQEEKNWLQKKKEMEEKLRNLGKEVEELEPKHHELKKLRDDKKKLFKAAMNEETKILHDLRGREQDKNELEKRIAELRNQDVEAELAAKKRDREEKIAVLEEKFNDLDATVKTTSHQMDQFLQAHQKYKEDAFHTSEDLKHASQALRGKQMELKQLEGSRVNKMRRFGDNMPNILNQISRAYDRGLFKEKPRGPIGANLTLRDPKWALSVEMCLKGLSFSFCVDNIRDQRVLEKIFSQVGGRKPTIICSKFLDHVHDVSTHKARSPHPTVLDMLEIQDPVIANALIDQRGVENLLLIENVTEARAIMSADQPPRNVREAFTPNGDQMFCSPTYRYYSSSKQKASLLTGDVEEEIAAAKEEITHKQKEIQALKQDIGEAEAEMNTNKTQANSCRTRVMKLTDQRNKIQMELNELRSVEDPAPVDVSALQEEVDRFLEQIQRLQTMKDAVDQQLRDVKAERDQAEQDFQEIAKRISTLANSSDPINDKLSAYQDRIQQTKNGLKHYEQKFKEHKAEVDKAKIEAEKLRKSFEDDVTKASLIWPERIETNKKPDRVEKEIQELIKEISIQEKSRGNEQEITKMYYEIMKKFMSIKEEVAQYRSFLKELRRVIELRANYFEKMMSTMAVRTNTFFVATLSSRNYQGKLAFDHKKHTLALNVQPNSQMDVSRARDMKALSGGERSFSTICFILALWEAMESPFRCLDEFDVFMDMVNRRISMELILRVTNQQAMRQFIFLTPLNMSYLNMRHSSTVSVFRMPDPDRGQGVLPFGQRNEDEEDNHQTPN